MKPAVRKISGLVAALFMGTAIAQGNTTQTTATQTPANQPPGTGSATAAQGGARATLAREDAGFLKQAAQNGHAELEASKLAQGKATHNEVKSFANRMVDDHAKSHSELAQLAASKGVTLDDEASMAQRAKLKLLAGLEGERFDRRYAQEFGVKAHEDTLKLFKKAAEEAKDPEVKAFAQKTLPVLQQHLEAARSMHSAVETAAKSAKTRGSERSAGGSSGAGSTTGSATQGSGDGGQGERKY